MKYCYACGRMTGGEPLFCNFCGKSYDVKLCPKLHVNSRLAEACSRCGSRELSIPQPKVPLSFRLAAFLVHALLGLILLFLTLPVALRLFLALFARADFSGPLMAICIFVAPSWFIWALLPSLLYRIIRRFIVSRNGAG